MRAPFPWFGGKRKVASWVWDAFGDIDNYIEPFAGSLAVLLDRPSWHKRSTEIVNDADSYIANFWRATQSDPEQVAHYADWPVNETDLFARHLWLVNEGRQQMIAGLEKDPEFFDAKIAGWWVWGQCSWIGGGWCSGKGPWFKSDDDSEGIVHQRSQSEGRGVYRQRPHITNSQGISAQGVTRQLPSLGPKGGINRKVPKLGGPQGIQTYDTANVSRKRPHITSNHGINRVIPHMGGARGINAGYLSNEGLYAYFMRLANRLRNVRVVVGDWSRVVTMGATTAGNSVGIFLDPPYGNVRTADLYAVDDMTVATDVARWCRENGDNPRYKIILCGYEGEHEMPADWEVIAYSAGAAYQNSTGGGVNAENRHKERLWLSPGCSKHYPLRNYMVFDADSSDDEDCDNYDDDYIDYDDDEHMYDSNDDDGESADTDFDGVPISKGE